MAKKKSSPARSSRPAGKGGERKGAGRGRSIFRRVPLAHPALWGLWLLLAATPFLFIPGLTDNFRPPKLYFTELAALLSLAGLALRLRLRPVDLPASFKRATVLHAVLPLAAVVSVGALLSDHVEHVGRSLPSFLIGAAAFVGWSLALEAGERRALLRFVAAGPAVVLALLAILQFHDLFNPFAFDSRVTERVGLTSSAGGVFDLAAYLFLPILILQTWMREANGRLRLALGAALALCTYSLLISRTFTVLAAVLVATALYHLPRLPRRRVAGALAASVLASALAVALVTPLQERVVSKVRSLGKGEINRALTGRLDGWRTAAHMWGEQPVLGVGQGAYRTEFGAAKMALQDEGVPFFRGQHQVFFVNAHNDFLEAAAEWGSLGVLALGFALITVYRGRTRRREGEGHLDDLRALEPAACAGLAVLAMANFPFHLALVAYPWLLFLSGFLGLKPPTAPDGESMSPAKGLRLPGVILALLFLAWFGLRFSQTRDLLGADRLLAMAETRTAQVLAGSGQATQIVHQNVGLLKKAQSLDPSSVAIKVSLAGQYILQKRWTSAERELKEAADLEPRAEVYANLAQVYLGMDKQDEAMTAIDTAIKLDHNQRKAFRSITDREFRVRRWQKQQQKGSGQ